MFFVMAFLRTNILATLAVMTLCAAGWSVAARAGGGPENVFLVVNPQSRASLSIANHFARLRQIPAGNILHLSWDPKAETTDIDTFRLQILMPILQAIDGRRLAGQIDYVVYSSDFPWGINLEGDFRKFQEAMQREQPPGAKPGDAPAKPEWPKLLTPVGSLTGLTYLWPAVRAVHPDYLQLQTNWYMRQSAPELCDAPSRAFRGARQYDRQGEVVRANGRRYMLSVMLGVTAGRGNSPAEAIGYLTRSAAADGTHPAGTIYFVQNGDIRSKVRQDRFTAAVDELKKLRVAAEVIEGTVPLNKSDVQGAMMGTAAFDWKASGSTILPGAICEHFTSFGGVMSAGAGQTPLSEFLRYGAAGSSGTVTEPYSIPDKFPTAMLQVHYARGCSLAEAFYQSVFGPYQLLIVGDPLCQPWADIPKVDVAGIEPGAAVRGGATLKPVATVPKGAAVDHFELFVDGLRAAETKPNEPIALSTVRLADGYHELRVVAVGAGPIETQGRRIIPITTANHGRKIEASVVTKPPLQADKPITIAAKSPGAIGILVIQGHRIVARIAGEQGQAEIAPNVLGAGPVELRVVGLGNGGAATHALAAPIELTIQ